MDAWIRSISFDFPVAPLRKFVYLTMSRCHRCGVEDAMVLQDEQTCDRINGALLREGMIYRSLGRHAINMALRISAGKRRMGERR